LRDILLGRTEARPPRPTATWLGSHFGR
jgi:hypothetical protein